MRSMKDQRTQAFEKFTRDCLKNHKFQNWVSKTETDTQGVPTQRQKLRFKQACTQDWQSLIYGQSCQTGQIIVFYKYSCVRADNYLSGAIVSQYIILSLASDLKICTAYFIRKTHI